MKKILSSNYEAFKLVRAASKRYISVTVIVQLLQIICVFYNLFYIQYLVSVITQNNIDMIVIWKYSIIYLIIVTCVAITTSWCSNSFNPIEEKKIQKYLNGIAFSKLESFKVEYFEDSNFYNKYVLAIKEIDNRVLEIVLTNITFIIKVLTILLMVLWIYQMNYIINIYILITVILHAIIGGLKEKQLYLRYINMIKSIRQIDYCRRIFYNNTFAKSVKLNHGLIDKMNNYYSDAIANIIIILKKYAKKIGIIDFISDILSNYLTIFLLIYLIVLVSNNQLTVSEFVLLTSLISSVSKDLMEIFVKFNEMYSNSLYMDNLNYILKIDKESLKSQLNAFKKENNEICINNIEFAYPNDKDRVISRLSNLKFHSGQKIAFVGENGSGKSTLSYLILNLYEIKKGNIYINRKAYCDLDERTFYKNVYCIFQDDEIYKNFSIAENILLRDFKDSDKPLIEEALKKVDMLDKVNNLEHGIHTKLTKEIEEDGVYLSRGEFQLIILARIFVEKKEMIILDEPFNHISQKKRSTIMKNINDFYNDKIVIYILHDNELLKEIDLIVNLDEYK